MNHKAIRHCTLLNILRTKSVANSVNRLDERNSPRSVEFLTQQAHIRSDRFSCDIAVQTPDAVDQRSRFHNFASIFKQYFKQAEFLGYELDFALSSKYSSGCRI